jgi:hypothetical protein
VLVVDEQMISDVAEALKPVETTTPDKTIAASAVNSVNLLIIDIPSFFFALLIYLGK